MGQILYIYAFCVTQVILYDICCSFSA